jgi:4-amino-4-deoxy-L-arabinose transferase-like glycosyltransferase
MNSRFLFLSRLPVGIYLVLILILGAALRFTGIEWDSNYHLHPDERFMSMVANDLKIPETWDDYFSPEYSPLSPYNIGHKNYLYGLLPLTFTKVLASVTNTDGYDQLYLLGRAISATLDSLAILLVFFLARSLAPRREANVAGLCAAAAYAICVLPIQNAHFFTVDIPLTFWTLVASLGAAKLILSKSRWQTLSALILCVIGLSFSIGCKISGVLVALPIGLAFAWRWKPWHRSQAERLLLACLMMTITTATVFRVISPPLFESSSWLNWQLNSDFLNSLHQQTAYIRGEAMMPPQYQWFLSTPILSPIKNIFFWSTGPFLGLTILAGLCLGFRDLVQRRIEIEKRVTSAILLVFFLLVFFYMGSRFVHTSRYLLPLLPIGCAFAGLALGRFWYYIPQQSWRQKIRWRWAIPVVLAPTLLYAVAFVSIYTRTTTRLQANQWFFEYYPQGASIAVEHWDDSLPVGYNPRIARFKMQTLNVFDEDKPEKINALYDVLSTSELYVLSSPRAWNTIGRLPSRFPLMTQFYDKLWKGELGWKKAVTLTSWPRLGPLEIPTLNAEEAFMVYDHPPVTIFRKQKSLTRQQFRMLFENVDYGEKSQ